MNAHVVLITNGHRYTQSDISIKIKSNESTLLIGNNVIKRKYSLAESKLERFIEILSIDSIHYPNRSIQQVV